MIVQAQYIFKFLWAFPQAMSKVFSASPGHWHRTTFLLKFCHLHTACHCWSREVDTDVWCYRSEKYSIVEIRHVHVQIALQHERVSHIGLSLELLYQPIQIIMRHFIDCVLILWQNPAKQRCHNLTLCDPCSKYQRGGRSTVQFPFHFYLYRGLCAHFCICMWISGLKTLHSSSGGFLWQRWKGVMPVLSQWVGSVIPVLSQWVGSVMPVLSQWVGSVIPVLSQWVGSVIPVLSQWVGSVMRSFLSGWVVLSLSFLSGRVVLSQSFLSGWVVLSQSFLSGWVLLSQSFLSWWVVLSQSFLSRWVLLSQSFLSGWVVLSQSFLSGWVVLSQSFLSWWVLLSQSFLSGWVVYPSPFSVGG